MAPRASKNKTPAKATLVAASAAFAPPPSNPMNVLGGEFFDIYNDLLTAKNDVLASTPGGARKRAITELGSVMVRHFLVYSVMLYVDACVPLG